MSSLQIGEKHTSVVEAPLWGASPSGGADRRRDELTSESRATVRILGSVQDGAGQGLGFTSREKGNILWTHR